MSISTTPIFDGPGVVAFGESRISSASCPLLATVTANLASLSCRTITFWLMRLSCVGQVSSLLRTMSERDALRRRGRAVEHRSREREAPPKWEYGRRCQS